MSKWFRWRRGPQLEQYRFDLPAVRSADEDLCFHVSLTVRWHLLPSASVHHDPLAAIRTHVSEVVHVEASREPVNRAALVQDRINSRMGLPAGLKESCVQLLWVEATVTVDSISLSTALRRAVRRSERRQQNEDQEAHVQRIETFRRRVLTKPDMALTFYFLENKGSLDESVLTHLEKLSKRIASYDPENYWIQVAEILLAFVRDLSDEERQDSIRALTFWLKRYDRKSLVADLESLQPSKSGLDSAG